MVSIESGRSVVHEQICVHSYKSGWAASMEELRPGSGMGHEAAVDCGYEIVESRVYEGIGDGRKRMCWVSESGFRMWSARGAVTQGGRGGLAYGCFRAEKSEGAAG